METILYTVDRIGDTYAYPDIISLEEEESQYPALFCQTNDREQVILAWED